MEDIYSFIDHEVQSERMVTRTHLLQKYPDERLQAISAFNNYYENNIQRVDAVFTVLQVANDGNGLISSLLSANQINQSMKIKDISLYALADKNLIVDEDLFPPSFKGQEPLKVTVQEVNLSSLVQAMTVESQKVVVNKKVDGLDHKRKNDSSDLNTQVNLSKQLKSTDPIKNDSLKTINENNPAQITNKDESKPENLDSVVKKPKIILKSKQQDQSKNQIQSQEQSNLIPIIEERIIKNDPIIEEPVKEIQKNNQINQPSDAPVIKTVKTSKPKTQQPAVECKKLDGFFVKKK